nr:hypothetical protein [Tanacetum cinerariifolium]
FTGAVQNAEVRGEPIPTMPFVTSSVSAIPEREGEGHTDSAEANFFARPFVLVLTATTSITLTVDPIVVVKEKFFKPSLFAAESTSVGRTDPAMAGLTDLIGSDFLVGGIRTVINLDSDMDIFALIHTSNPTKVKVVKRERKEDEPWLLETTVGRIVPLLPVAPDRSENELDASVDKLFDKGGSDAQMEQGDSADGRGEQSMNIQPDSETTDAVVENVIPLQPRRLKKRKTIVADAGGKSMSTVQRLFTGAVQNAEVRGEPIPTMPFVTSSVSAIPATWHLHQSLRPTYKYETSGDGSRLRGTSHQSLRPTYKYETSGDGSRLRGT